MSKNESKKFDIEWKIARFKYQAKRRFQNGVNWIVRNKELVMFALPVIAGAATTVAKVVGKRVNLHKEANLKNLYCYDRSAGHYWELKRKLTKSEWVEIDRRRVNGERYADILSSMNVLK